MNARVSKRRAYQLTLPGVSTQSLVVCTCLSLSFASHGKRFVLHHASCPVALAIVEAAS